MQIIDEALNSKKIGIFVLYETLWGIWLDRSRPLSKKKLQHTRVEKILFNSEKVVAALITGRISDTKNVKLHKELMDIRRYRSRI